MSNDSIAAGQETGNLNFTTAQKMIHRLLTHERIKTALDEGRVINHVLKDEPEIKLNAYTKEELARKLGISLEEFDKLRSADFYKKIVKKISLPLSQLYCSTKFV